VEQPEVFEKVLDNLAPIVRDADVTLIPVAHALKRRLTLAYLGSSADIPHLDPPTGTHPLRDSNDTSRDLTLRHDGIALSRLSKARLVADWPIALDHLRVCNNVGADRRDALNCGRASNASVPSSHSCASALDRRHSRPSICRRPRSAPRHLPRRIARIRN
jgi:hypothetical protein